METNFPFRTLFSDRLVPMMAKGHVVTILNESFRLDQPAQEFVSFDESNPKIKSYCDPYILMQHMAKLIIKSQPSGAILLDGQCYMKTSDIDAWFPDLTCCKSADGARYESWVPGCGGCL